MTHGSLFSGIGGFDLAAEWMGWENLFHCEWNEFGQKILKHYWPGATSYANIKETDFSSWNGRIDVLSGGFPCQPYSSAGKRLGKEDERHLWPEMLRSIREIQPSWVVGENVRGLTNWSGGLVFDEVQADLEAEGYDILPFLLPAAGVNAPHQRDRIWFIAHTQGFNDPGNQRSLSKAECGQEWHNLPASAEPGTRLCKERLAANGYRPGLQVGVRKGIGGLHESPGPSSGRQSPRVHSADVWGEFPTESPLCRDDDGVPYRMDRIKALGNAVVPQVVYQIYKSIEQYEQP
jgi:DNA (cytosine-5)-methyltransferase 1